MATIPRSTASAARAAKSIKQRSAASKPKRLAALTGKPDIRIFMSYSHQDAAAQAKLNTHLAPWRRDGVTVWYDENIEPGAGLSTEIARELRRAHIFVALFSPAYLDSHYCWDIEYKRAMARRARKLVRVVAVVVKPCGWKQTRAAGFKLLPKDGIPPEGWSSSDAAYLNAAQGIGEVIKAVRRELTAKPAALVRGASKLSKKPRPRSTPAKATTAGTGKTTVGFPTTPGELRPRSRKAPIKQ
ncbi:MAG: toll/interleukin-1 receptor domain-containing protein [Oxalobacteraceae bacterium]|nr:MAG: toll/interleukin-1 receptor domain-containing protein [Oxalobacteraceae bacterium]